MINRSMPPLAMREGESLSSEISGSLSLLSIELPAAEPRMPLPPARAQAIVASRVFDGREMRGARAAIVRDGRIAGLAEPGRVPADCEPVILPEGAVLAPGFIDVQVNGGGGTLLNDNPGVPAMAAIARAHRRFGTTGCLPTLITDEPSAMARAIAAARQAVTMPGVLGLHLEGPFLNPARRGVHREDLIATPDMHDADMLAELGGVGACQVTLAPERVPKGFIARLVAAGLRVSAGHTDATAEQLLAAADEGLTGVTHLFNAVSQMQAREPGVAGAALADDRIFAGIICDGHHVGAATMRAAYRAKGAGRIMLVTDAMPLVGTDRDRFMLVGKEIVLRDGRLTEADGGLAGAHLDMAGAVRNAVALIGAPLEDALTMASLTPAAFLGLDDRLGRIAPDYAADLVALDRDLRVVATWIAGAAEWVR
jgi:N-acetylglucosamine-6-phosphate deacetylase